MVQIIAISPDGDTVRHRREDHFKIEELSKIYVLKSFGDGGIF